MQATDLQRPATLYRYSRRHWLERALTLGEFRLRPAVPDLAAGGPRSMPAAGSAGYLMLSLAQSWSERLLNQFPRADGCLVIHDSEQFGERLHRAVLKALPSWAGIDAAVRYGQPSALGAAFSGDRHFAFQQEWRFAWRPTQPVRILSPIVIRIGNIEDFAELRAKGHAARAG